MIDRKDLDDLYVNVGVPLVEVVRMRRNHLSSVMAIDAETTSQPWSMSLFLNELATKDTRNYSVALVDGEVVGFCGVMYMVDEAHVTTLAVAPEWHRRQIATRLL